VDPARQLAAPGVPPVADFVDQHAAGQRGPRHPGHLARRERRRRARKLAGRRADRAQVGAHAVLRVQDPAHRPAERADLDRVEVQGGQLAAEIDRSFGRLAPVAPHPVKRQTQPRRRRPIIRHHVDQLRPGPGLVAEGRQPAGPDLGVGLELALVENHHDRLVGLHGGAEELFHRRVVVLLLREHGQHHVGGAADGPGPLPVDRHVAVDVGGVEHQQARRQGLAATPEEAILRGVFQRVVGRLPRAKLEPLEEPPQDRRIVDSRRHQADRVARAGGQGPGGAGHLAGQMVENHRLADVRSADDRRDQQRRLVELRQQLVAQEPEPFLTIGRRDAHTRRHRAKRPQGFGQAPELSGKSVVGFGHGHGAIGRRAGHRRTGRACKERFRLRRAWRS